MSVFANENNDVTLFREVNCKMRLFAMKYSIEFEEKYINIIHFVSTVNHYILTRFPAGNRLLLVYINS